MRLVMPSDLTNRDPLATAEDSGVQERLQGMATAYSESPAIRVAKSKPDLFETLDPWGKLVLEVIEFTMEENRDK